MDTTFKKGIPSFGDILPPVILSDSEGSLGGTQDPSLRSG